MLNAHFYSRGVFITFCSLCLLLSSSVFAEKITLIAGLVKAPYIIEENGSGTQLDIVREAMKKENVEVNFIHVPLARGMTTYQSYNLGGVITLPTDFEYPNLFMSQPYINYQNVAISLSESQLAINTLQDLSGKSVVAFQNAKKFLGEEYNKVVSYAIDYRELAQQEKQIEMLFMRRTEVIVLDLDIFLYFVKTHSDPIFTKDVIIHRLFASTEYTIGFRDNAIRDKFNNGLRLLKAQGEYQTILDNYLLK